MTPIVEFECCRPVDGHRLIDLDERKLVGFEIRQDGEEPISVVPPPNATEDERYLLKRWGMLLVPTDDKPTIVHLLLPRSSRIERFDLFERAPALFREVASAQTTVEGVTKLADRYGPLLGADRPQDVEDWYSAIRAMRRAVAAWEEAKSTGDYRKVARLIKRRAGTPVHLYLREASGTGGRLCARPSTLADAIWVQLTFAVDARQTLTACAECRKWYTVEAGAARSDKQYCSDACKMRAYRKRKKGHS